MEPIKTFLSENQTLEEFYNGLTDEIAGKAIRFDETFSTFTHDLLLQPAEWFKALAVFEKALETDLDVSQAEIFFKKIFKGYDHNAAVGLNNDDYKFYWDKINQVFETYSKSSTEALIEQALQYYAPRREYKDHAKLLEILQKAVDKGSENAKVILGYYLYNGFCSAPDKEKGLELIESVTSPKYRQKAAMYKNYILLSEDKKEEALNDLDQFLVDETDPDILRMAYEQKGFILELDGKYDESAEYYKKVLTDVCSGFCAMRLGFYQYNQGNHKEGLELMEKAFCYGRPEVARSLFHCYFESELEWQDNDRGVFWIKKGYEYYDSFSTFQLAILALYNEGYQDVEKGLIYLDKAIELNNPDALGCKARMYYDGEIIEKDIDKGIELFNKSLELGYGYAGYRLGLIHEEGELNNGEPDYVTALSYYEKAAELDNIHGIEMAGRYNLIGVGCEENNEKALEYYTRGVEMGSSYCKVELAFMYEEGNGVEQDSNKMFELIKDAAEDSYPYALYLLGRCYRHALGTEEDPDEAVRYLQLAADADVIKGLAELALCYEEGYGMEANGKKALEYMLKAAEKGYPVAQYKVGCYYLYGLEDVPVDNQESFKWMSQAAENQYPYALMEMGDYYLWDYGDLGQKEKAYEYYVKAAEHDFINEGMGLCLEYGIGVEENEPEAFRYYLKAAEDGYARAMYNAGRCYYFGYGIKENLYEAFRWFNDAANYELTSAMYYKGKMLLDGEGCTQNMEEGVAYLTKAAENDNANAQYVLANCYLVGKGVDVDEDRAMELFELAAENGHEGAAKVTGKRRRR